MTLLPTPYAHCHHTLCRLRQQATSAAAKHRGAGVEGGARNAALLEEHRVNYVHVLLSTAGPNSKYRVPSGTSAAAHGAQKGAR